jgi:F-type H+-transporting ATPase subunit delta
MNEHVATIAKRYSAALDGCLDSDQVVREVQYQTELFLSLMTPDVEAFFAKETIPTELKQSILDDLLKQTVAHEYLARTLALMATRNRLGALRLFLQDLRSRLDTRLGIRRVDYVVAAPLNQDERASVEQSLAEVLGSKIKLTVRVDSSLLAGCIVRLGNLVADLSLKTRLKQLKESLSEGA